MDAVSLYNVFSKCPIVVSFFRKITDKDKLQIGRQEVRRDQLVSSMNEFFNTSQHLFENDQALFLNGNKIAADFEQSIIRNLKK